MPAPLLNRLLYRHRLLNSNPDEHTPAPVAPQEQPQDAPEALPPGDTQEPPATVVTVETPTPVAADPGAPNLSAIEETADNAEQAAEIALEAARENQREIEEQREWRTKTEAEMSSMREALTSLTAMTSEMASNLSALMEALTATEPPPAPEIQQSPPNVADDTSSTASAQNALPNEAAAPEAPPAATAERNAAKKSAKSQRSWI